MSSFYLKKKGPGMYYDSNSMLFSSNVFHHLDGSNEFVNFPGMTVLPFLMSEWKKEGQVHVKFVRDGDAMVSVL